MMKKQVDIILDVRWWDKHGPGNVFDYREQNGSNNTTNNNTTINDNNDNTTINDNNDNTTINDNNNRKSDRRLLFLSYRGLYTIE